MKNIAVHVSVQNVLLCHQKNTGLKLMHKNVKVLKTMELYLKNG